MDLDHRQNALLLARGHPITPDIFKTALGRVEKPQPPKSQTITEYVGNLLERAKRGELQNVEAALTWDLERELYRQAFELAEGNQTEAAKWLGVSRPTMREKLRAYGLRAPSEADTPPPET